MAFQINQIGLSIYTLICDRANAAILAKSLKYKTFLKHEPEKYTHSGLVKHIASWLTYPDFADTTGWLRGYPEIAHVVIDIVFLN